MIAVTEYVPADGRIKALHSFPDEESYLLNQKQDSEYIVEYWEGADYYVVNGQPVERPAQSTTLVGTVLTNMPIPATLLVDGARIEVDDGEAELELLLSGTYKLRVEAWPYKDWEGEVTV